MKETACTLHHVRTQQDSVAHEPGLSPSPVTESAGVISSDLTLPRTGRNKSVVYHLPIVGWLMIATQMVVVNFHNKKQTWEAFHILSLSHPIHSINS